MPNKPKANLSDTVNDYLNQSDPTNLAARNRGYQYYLPGSEKEAKAKAAAASKDQSKGVKEMTPEQKKSASKNAIAMQRAQKAIRKNEDPNKGNFTFEQYKKMKKDGTFKGSDNYTGSKN